MKTAIVILNWNGKEYLKRFLPGLVDSIGAGTGTSADNFTRTPNRHDFALSPPSPTMLDILESHGKDVISIGKIHDIFNGKGITESYKTTGNADGMEKISKIK